MRWLTVLAPEQPGHSRSPPILLHSCSCPDSLLRLLNRQGATYQLTFTQRLSTAGATDSWRINSRP